MAMDGPWEQTHKPKRLRQNCFLRSLSLTDISDISRVRRFVVSCQNSVPDVTVVHRSCEELSVGLAKPWDYSALYVTLLSEVRIILKVAGQPNAPPPSPSPRTAPSPPYLLISWLNCRVQNFLACENIRFSSLFAAGDVTSPAAKSEEKRMFSQAKNFLGEFRISKIHTQL